MSLYISCQLYLQCADQSDQQLLTSYPSAQPESCMILKIFHYVAVFDDTISDDDESGDKKLFELRTMWTKH